MKRIETPIGHINNSRIPDLVKQTKEGMLSNIDGKAAKRHTRINVCPACNAQKNGVKSRISLPHTCGL